MNGKLFAAVCPTFGHKFAFNTDSLKEAQHIIYKWNSYHGFRGADVEHTVEEIDESQLADLRISVHNEFVSFLVRL